MLMICINCGNKLHSEDGIEYTCSCGYVNHELDANLEAFNKSDIKDSHGKYVAFVHGKYYGMDASKINLAKKVYEQHGNVSMHIDTIPHDNRMLSI